MNKNTTERMCRKSKLVSFRIPVSIHDRYKERCNLESQTMTQVARKAVMDYMDAGNTDGNRSRSR